MKGKQLFSIHFRYSDQKLQQMKRKNRYVSLLYENSSNTNKYILTLQKSSVDKQAEANIDKHRD